MLLLRNVSLTMNGNLYRLTAATWEAAIDLTRIAIQIYDCPSNRVIGILDESVAMISARC